MPPDFFKRMISVCTNPEPHPDDSFFLWGKGFQYQLHLLGYFIPFSIRVRRRTVFISNKIFKFCIFFSNWSLESNRVLYCPEDLFHLPRRHCKFFGNLLIGGFSSKLLFKFS